jgi:hypothetical protein
MKRMLHLKEEKPRKLQKSKNQGWEPIHFKIRLFANSQINSNSSRIWEGLLFVCI